MPDVSLIGPISIAVDGLRTLISAVPFFQTWTGTADAAAALLRIYTGEIGSPIDSFLIASGVLVISTREPHGLLAGAGVTVDGASVGSQSSCAIAGAYTISAVTSLTISLSSPLANQSATYPDQAFVMPGVRPIAIVSESPEPVNSVSIGTGGANIYSGAVDILVEADVSSAYVNDARNALFEARNSFGSFIQDLGATQGTLDYMCLNDISVVMPPEFINKDSENDSVKRFERWRALIRVTWGLRS